MRALIYIILFYLLTTFMIVLIVLHGLKHSRSTSRIINTDTFMCKFIFKVPLPADAIISALATKNIHDTLSCKIDTKQSTIQFSDINSSRKYFYAIHSSEGYSIFYLSHTAWIGSRSTIPYKINPFIISKLNAEPVPYWQYADLFIKK